MASTAQAASPTRASVARKPRTPRALQRRKLTLSRAVEQWAETQLAMDGLKALRDEAATVILEHASRTDQRTYKDKIAVVQTGGSLVLDQAKIKEELGDQLPRFQKRTALGLALKLLR